MPPSRRKLPSTASVAHPAENGKLHAPSAARNVGAIVEAIAAVMPASGKALEIASGTGEHVVRYAAAFSGLDWQPSDIDADRLNSISAWSAETGLPNILPPQMLDATKTGWAVQQPPQNVVILSNLLHLISMGEAAAVIAESAQALAPDGVFLIYGPFLRGATFASAADQRFDQSLRGKDPDIGYKSYQTVQDVQGQAGLLPLERIEMPSNNLLLAARKPR